jgi:putative transposase
MTTSNLPNRKLIRLQNYDYSRQGLYFVTICSQDRQCLFGSVTNDNIFLNDAGKMLEYWWKELENKFEQVSLEQYVVMPNHLHGVILLNTTGGHIGPRLQEIIQWFKTMTTNEYIRGVKQGNFSVFNKKLWQRSYYEHIIRNEEGLNKAREYILNNPLQWHLDQENPQAIQG